MNIALKNAYLIRKKRNEIVSLNGWDGFKGILRHKPLVVFMNGSGQFTLNGLNKNQLIIDTLMKDNDVNILIPNSYAHKNRPMYRNPDSKENYKRVLDLRQEELEDTLFELKKLGVRDIVLIGNSEGAVCVLNRY